MSSLRTGLRMHGLRQPGSRSGKQRSTRVHCHVSDPGQSIKGQRRRSEQKTLDDSKQTANWGRSLQIIHEEVGLTDSAASQNRRLLTSSTAAHYIDHHPKLASSMFFDVGPLTRAWLEEEEEKHAQILTARNVCIIFKEP